MDAAAAAGCSDIPGSDRFVAAGDFALLRSDELGNPLKICHPIRQGHESNCSARAYAG